MDLHNQEGKVTFTVMKIPALELTDEQKSRTLNWIEKLESGEFLQITSVLRGVKNGIPYGIGYCCLGVACEISGLGKWGTEIPSGKIFQHLFVLNGEVPSPSNAYESLPPSQVIQDWFGMPEDVGFEIILNRSRFRTDDREKYHIKRLPGLNDAGVTFAEIAKVLRAAVNGGYTNSQYDPTISVER
ncbi:hypothetical protein D3C87_459930 [compost metagenome]